MVLFAPAAIKTTKTRHETNILVGLRIHIINRIVTKEATMLVNHPYVHDTQIINTAQPDGTNERVLVVKTRMWWASEYSVGNDNRLLLDLSEQIRRLEKTARFGGADFDRIDVVSADDI